MRGWKKTGAMGWEPDPETATDFSDQIGHIIAFTNVDGDAHYDLIIDAHASGQVRVYFDEFVALRRRVGPGADGSATAAGRFWVRPDAARSGTRYDIYPPDAIDVRWQNEELRRWMEGVNAR